jgi:diguanylate cyclase (GGDEF)-like protein/hemerythrin-like metal-binding protein
LETFVWDRHFTTGLDSVDEQHHRLVDLVNRLGESMVEGRDDGESLARVFEQLAEYADFHFADEERLMAEAGVYARHLQHHQEAHRRFMQQVASMWAARHAATSPASALHGFLSAWLSFHILGEDQAMARQIAAIRAGEPPAQAYAREEAPKDNATTALLRALRNLYHVLSQQNHDLATANQSLEERVAARTEELARTNQALTVANRELEKSSRTDGLLGIANRMYFDEMLAEEWCRARRERTSLALLMIDVDHFKRFNDCYGHQAGDGCLQAVARAVAAALHRPADMVARYGGEEMVVMLPNTTLDGARAVARSMLAAVKTLAIPHAASPVTDRVTVSIGVAAMTPDPVAGAERLVAVADAALYTAKAAGRDRMGG